MENKIIWLLFYNKQVIAYIMLLIAPLGQMETILLELLRRFEVKSVKGLSLK